jgi:hypothetical protein
MFVSRPNTRIELLTEPGEQILIYVECFEGFDGSVPLLVIVVLFCKEAAYIIYFLDEIFTAYCLALLSKAIVPGDKQI